MGPPSPLSPGSPKSPFGGLKGAAKKINLVSAIEKHVALRVHETPLGCLTRIATVTPLAAAGSLCPPRRFITQLPTLAVAQQQGEGQYR